MEPFRLTEIERRPGCRELRVTGELDLAVAPQLEEAIDRAEGCEQILVNLRDCEFIDSTGIAVVVNAHHRLQDQGRYLALYGAVEQVLRVLSISGLTDNNLVFETAEEAETSGTTD